MPAPNTLIGRILGGYVIQSQIGSGGMGIVYRAHDERLGRTVAIKVLPPKFRADETFRQRFLREGRTAARIDHPNVVRILSAGEEGHLAFLVMEFVDGGSLQRLLEKKIRVPIATTVRIIRQVAEALHAAHKVGVMHRDVKPANVLFTKEGEPKLVDFGLAREETSEVNLSQPGMVMGTPHYMAPEVCEGKKADARADIYALAVVMYAMIAGRLPFDGETAIAILMAHIQKPVPPIPEAPRAVAAVLARALVKDPAKRYQTGAEFSEALGRAAETMGTEDMSGVGPTVLAPALPLPAAQPSPPPPSVALSSAHGEAAFPTPGGLLPTAVTPSAGVSAARPRVPLAAWTAAGAAAAVLLGIVGIVVAMKSSKKSAVPPVVFPTSANTAPTPEQPPLPHPDADDAAWEMTLKATGDRAHKLEVNDEFANALELWNAFPTPDTRSTAAVAREKSALMSRASLRAQKEIDNAPRGAVGAKHCRELAAKLPPEAAAPLLQAAAANAQDWQPRDGLAALRGMLAARDPRTAGAALAALDEPTSVLEKSTLAGARLAVDRLKLVLGRAEAWYASHVGTSVDIRRMDGTLVQGSIRKVDEHGEELVIGTRDGQVSLRTTDVLASELADRALDGCPPDDVVLAAVDVTLFCGGPREAWPYAIRAGRRGLALAPDREKLLHDEIPAADRDDADARRKVLEDEGLDAAKRSGLAREWLQRFATYPFDPHQVSKVRDALRLAGGPASVADLGLCLAGEISETDGVIAIRWKDVDSLLADFQPLVRAVVAPGDVAALKPTGDGACLLLHGLRWSDVTIEADGRVENSFALLTGWRGYFERLSIGFIPADHGGRAVQFPVAGEAFLVPAGADGWQKLALSLRGRHLEVTVGTEPHASDLPTSGSGEVGLWFNGTVSFRSLEVRGRPEFIGLTPDEEFRALEKSAKRAKNPVKASWRTWTAAPAPGKGDKITVTSGEEFEWLRPKTWEAGDDYRVSFLAHAWGNSELAIDLRTNGTSRRRVFLGADPHNGTLVGGRFLISGPGAPLAHEDDVRITVLVHGDLAQIEMNGKLAWRGHLEGLPHGGMEVGVRRGSVQLGGLQVEELDK